jgi:hypothetical protein
VWISLLEHVNCMKNCFLCLFSPFGQQKLKFFSAMSFFCFSIFSLCLVEFSLYLQEQIWLSHILARKLNIKVCQHNHQAYHGININVCGVWHQYYNISTDSKSYLVLAMASHLAQCTSFYDEPSNRHSLYNFSWRTRWYHPFCILRPFRC